MAIKNFNSSRSGQSLIEVMVAMTLLTVGFLGAVALLSRSLALNRFTSENITATYLASEGIEVAKNLIDHDVFAQEFGRQGAGWGSCFGNGGNFEIDYTTGELNGWGTCGNLIRWTGSGDFLKYDGALHVYGYQSGSPTIFTREIGVVNGSNSEITVSSTVFWAGFGGAAESVTLEDHFYDWYGNASTTP